jgi:hypothetical protein
VRNIQKAQEASQVAPREPQALGLNRFPLSGATEDSGSPLLGASEGSGSPLPGASEGKQCVRVRKLELARRLE